MLHLGVLGLFYAGMRPTKVRQPHREPTHPAVRPRSFGKGQGLAPRAPIAQATCAVMSRHNTRLDRCIPQHVQHMIESRLPPDHPALDTLDSTLGVNVFSLAIGQPVRPADEDTGGPPRLGITPSQCVYNG